MSNVPCAMSLPRVVQVERLIHLLVIASKGTRHSSSSDGRVGEHTMHPRGSAAGGGKVVRGNHGERHLHERPVTNDWNYWS